MMDDDSVVKDRIRQQAMVRNPIIPDHNVYKCDDGLCTEDQPCCERRSEYNGYHSGSLRFTCPKHCMCHD
jgi:hypothetical protein